MNSPIRQPIRQAIHYSECHIDIQKGWFIVDVSRMYGKRNLYSDLYKYIYSYTNPKIFIPDARIITQDVAQQISMFLSREAKLELLVLYDRPEDVPEILRYYIDLIIPNSSSDPSSDPSSDSFNMNDIISIETRKHTLLHNLMSIGFLTKERVDLYEQS